MLIVVSPAKSLDYESKLATRKRSEPRLLDRSRELVEVMAQKSPQQLSTLMSISPALGELNHERFQDWETPFTPENSRPAVLAFNGDVYLGMEPQTFSERDFTHAQKTLRILSGLYGVLRPLDLMQPYRLEMGSRVATARGKDLYGFWGDSITDVLNADIEASPGANALINLASNEYFGAVNTRRLEARLVSPVFLDSKNGAEPRIVSFFAKRARGSMAGWIIRNRVSSVRALAGFAEDGYEYDPDRSDAHRPVFVRYNRS
ncbi:MAG: peroxide stress protein YaaA [Acidimicrobiaceae bacterium]|nr:peroxide stress protein YaaA [Acidimicrobiaceae bacterium]